MTKPKDIHRMNPATETRARRSLPLGLSLLMLAAFAAPIACDSSSTTSANGQTDFTGEEGMSANRGATDSAGAATPTTAGGAKGAAPGAPMGRTGTVEEADIYRIDKNRLFYLNTYKGFLVYDVADAKNPKRLSQLPVYGYPVEMFVQGNIVYALLRDVLYMSQVSGKVQFERRNVSQLVAIDVSDVANPRVLKTVDIVGQLREGVSRKIDNTVYVVSYIPQSYYWGWQYELTDPQKEQAWVYSFNVADPTDLKLVQKLKIFEGGSVSDTDPVTGGQVTRYFSDVAISATSNALMVVENWYLSSWTPPAKADANTPWTCGTYAGDQRAVVSIVDVSNPSGVIRLHTRFQTRGALGDQFKQTYVFDDVSKTGTYYGIFARQGWTSTANCSGTSFVQNSFESWDVTNGAAPKKLDALDFGKPNETVRGTTFDSTRQVAFAVTAQSIDPLYVLSYADRTKLKIRSQIDGLSGDMNLFRLVEGNKFLVGIGRDASESCTGFQNTETRRSTGVAVSLIDVQNLDAIRLVQRQCVAVDGDWVSSEINWNLDQAHKMIGMQSDGTTTVITVPVSYAKRSKDNDWWWYHYETAVGIMSYDVSKYDPAKAASAQNVIQNYGTFVHPNGEVRRSIVFTHEETTPRRMMINLSDTHISIADIQDLAKPVLQAVVEVAPYVDRVFAFGDYIVESVTESPDYWSPRDGKTEFRIHMSGSDPQTAPVLARFSVGQVQSVIPHGNQLIVYRTESAASKDVNVGTTYTTEILVYDMTNPAEPALVGRTTSPDAIYPYYPYFCGVGMGYWYWYGGSTSIHTTDGLVFSGYTYDSATGVGGMQLTTLDLKDPTQPTLFTTPIPTQANRYTAGLVADEADPSGFFLNYWDSLGYRTQNGYQLQQSRHYAQRWSRAGANWKAGTSVNLPGTLIRTWKHSSGDRAYLTSDNINYIDMDTAGNSYWRSDTRINLLRGLTAPGKEGLAQLVSTSRFDKRYVSDLVVEGDTLLANVGTGYWGWGVADSAGGGVATGAKVASPGASVSTSVATSALAAGVEDYSDRLVAFDLSKFTLDRVYDQATGTQGVQFMGTHNGSLFMNISGDGILAVDVRDPRHPVGKHFLRTLGWATHIAFAGNDAYVASGYFGLYRMPLDGPSNLSVLTSLTAP